MTNLSRRSTLPEKMDDANALPDHIIQALEELETVNKLLGGFNVTLSALDKLKLDTKLKVVMDVGSGGGDVLRKIWMWGKRNNKNLRLIGVDRNPIMTSFASAKANHLGNLQFITNDIFDDALLIMKPDVVISSLFCHHFDNEDLIHLVKRMVALCSSAVIINDLHRNWLAYHSIKIITALFSKTPLVKYDAPLSVARSLTRKEWMWILEKAGVTNYTIKWMWAWRWQIILYK